MSNQSNEISPVKLARIAGVLYLLIFICAGFAQGAVRGSIHVPGDAVATASNIVAHEFFFRSGFVADILAFMSDAAVAVLLYVLLLPVNKTLSLLAAAFRLLAHPAIATVNLLNHYMALEFAKGADYLTVFSTQQTQSLALFFLDMHRFGYLIAGAFFGLSLLLLGYLLYKSPYFPRIIGVLIAIAAFGYFIESFGTFLFGHKELYTMIVGITAVIGELSLTLWLLIKGVRTT